MLEAEGKGYLPVEKTVQAFQEPGWEPGSVLSDPFLPTGSWSPLCLVLPSGGAEEPVTSTIS